MPTKNSRKVFIEQGYYHLYNRGVAKQDIFREKDDYRVFLRFLKEYLLPQDHPDVKKFQELTPRRHPINCFEHIKLLAYCLMPNHFHLLVKNLSQRGIERFMRAMGTNYTMYFNRKYERVGPLCQGIYKAVLIETNEQLVYTSKYIHRNPKTISLARVGPLQEYSYSSYPNYLGKRDQDWIDIDEILAFFSNAMPTNSYQAFVEEIDTPHIKEFEFLLIDSSEQH